MVTMTWPEYLRRTARVDGRVINLKVYEDEILLFLLLRQDQLTPRTFILDVLWGDREDGGPLYAFNVITASVMTLRKKIAPNKIIMEIDRGYRLEHHSAPASKSRGETTWSEREARRWYRKLAKKHPPKKRTVA